ncbi:HPr-rel-A system PqqD family peptide chaperone [Aquisalimonas sp.]|uniref:HPr-rel-A system PqqD family peptide chaperone n=1 Tax=Aquisalimonas sp. TaxID=1872621 RepID=UPI0034543153
MTDAPGVCVGALYWVAHPEAGCRWLSGEEAVVFLPGSGDTHLINSLAADVLVRLQATPGGLTADGLCAALPAAGVDSPRELAAAVDAVLHEFERIAIVRRARS